MVERVKRFMHEASVAMQDLEGKGGPIYLAFEDLPEREQRWFDAFARAAIEGMRVMSPDMQSALIALDYEMEALSPEQAIPMLWERAIDTALGKK